jgi:hypothetical protein
VSDRAEGDEDASSSSSEVTISFCRCLIQAVIRKRIGFYVVLAQSANTPYPLIVVLGHALTRFELDAIQLGQIYYRSAIAMDSVLSS